MARSRTLYLSVAFWGIASLFLLTDSWLWSQDSANSGILKARQLSSGDKARAQLIAISIKGRDAEVGNLYSKAYALFWKGDYQESRVIFTAITLVTDDPRAWLYLGLTEQASGDTAAAVASVRRGWKLARRQSDPSSLHRALERLQGSQRRWLEGLRAEPDPDDVSDRSRVLEIESRLTRIERQLDEANRLVASAGRSPRPAFDASRADSGEEQKPADSGQRRHLGDVSIRSHSEVRITTHLQEYEKLTSLVLVESTAWAEEEVVIETTDSEAIARKKFSNDGAEALISDTPSGGMNMTPEGEDLIKVPISAHSVAIVFNSGELPTDLRLSREALLGIFSGRLKRWNDPLLVACNPGSALPNVPVKLVCQSGQSGVTWAVTRYLSAIDPAWRDGLGVGTEIMWPVGTTHISVEATLREIAGTLGCVGVVDSRSIEGSGLAVARIENSAGNYIAPTPDRSRDTLASIPLPYMGLDGCADVHGDTGYPLLTFTWFVCRREHARESTAASLRRLVQAAVTRAATADGEGKQAPFPRKLAESLANMAITAIVAEKSSPPANIR